ncbi:PREDICTED: uncharacterized protein LOC105556393 [Vollenhovia emeryi]|uniref:uncharacterized protein LOC105556393 n=1 Tax=Vollenhovia emeryi TaxID=411798 RepID=UPI0005F419E7|nr:PREDICTED: uncharacterized protein LOC105556393 [Vollenhovia emeryi]
MGRTRSQTRADRARLEKSMLKELQEEARRYHVTAPKDRRALTEAIMAHLEKNAAGTETGESSTAVKTRKEMEQTGDEGRNTIQQVAESVAGVMRQQQEMQRFMQQQQITQLLQLLTAQNAATTTSTGTDDAETNGLPSAEGNETDRSPPSMGLQTQRQRGENFFTGSQVTSLASQIPEFSGGEEENVMAWIRRVEKIRQVHGAPEGVTLLAASSCLTKAAKRWYDTQESTVLDSWDELRTELAKLFDRKIPFFKMMQKIEASKWNAYKERIQTFDEYALEKLALMHRLDLPIQDSIQLLISGITQSSLRATALSVTSESMDSFLEKMRLISQGALDPEKKTSTQPKQQGKNGTCKNCGKKGHNFKECKAEISCFYCKEKGHRSYDCPSLKQRNNGMKPKTQAKAAYTAASVTQPEEDTEVVATVEDARNLEINEPLVRVTSLNEETGTEDKLETVMENTKIDFDREDKRKLRDIVSEVNELDIPLVEDGYMAVVNLKDSSTYAYAPRRFAHAERLQIREITDDLLKRGIISESRSPYCARVVPIRKKDGRMRLCVDLRPLNSRVEKQKYPFPLIEDCLSRLSRKKVFTLLDLRDGFHQIRVHPESTKYFSFATPDGQYEYLKLPFVKENLETLKEVMIILKKYRFELNFGKCQFLRKEVEFLGYLIREDGITLSPKHTEAFAIKAKPLQKLLRKDSEFSFDAACQRAFAQLKDELTSSPILRLYDPAAETELHTDASIDGLAAILLQKLLHIFGSGGMVRATK